ncbi:PREDICTED: protein phosphatase 1 regulatory subunit 32 [Myotis davidii]|uniref:protein phosphatase 1 regulatory subunit 32 n=1 Tax=Myotis davidii TaxID=225400 RepID=UPI0007677076|nr:PREDICTED: protein phosphatase 1 regulatory subunit 32 [Myotis davidii]
MTGKIPLGIASPYVKSSSGGCADPMKFYATTYCTAYGRDFKPRMGSHKGTGYKSNYRPAVSYQAGLHAPDNPAMGEQVRDSFQTVTSQSYRPLEVPDGKCPLPGGLYQTSSGYSREKASTAPTSKEVRKVHFDTQDYGPQAITGLEPKHVPLLQQQNKGSVEWENARHGPRFMASEYNSKYLKEASTQPDLLQKKSIGAKERSGFTEGSTKNPIAFQAPSQALPGDPALLPGQSTSKADFLPMTHLHGDELLPQVTRGSEWETGFSRVNERILGSRGPGCGLELSGPGLWSQTSWVRIPALHPAAASRRQLWRPPGRLITSCGGRWASELTKQQCPPAGPHEPTYKVLSSLTGAALTLERRKQLACYDCYLPHTYVEYLSKRSQEEEYTLNNFIYVKPKNRPH